MMIIKATAEHAQLLSEIGSRTFIDAHKDSAPAHEIDRYVEEHYSIAVMTDELSNPKNNYYLAEYEGQVAGYSNIVFDSPCPGITQQNIAKLDRIYLDKEFYGLQLGARLFGFNQQLSVDHKQAGMWLVVWIKNYRAISFYERLGFIITSEEVFRLTDTHSNPCCFMFLDYSNTGIK